MKCYLCNSGSFNERPGKVRDAPKIKILECRNCGLVFLDQNDQIYTGFYENSGMHGKSPPKVESWLKDVSGDDQRRFNFLKTILPNKRILDFGCGAGGFLLKAKEIASDVVGVELESRVRSHWKSQISIYENLKDAGGEFDLITAFHVVEHLPDPRTVLQTLSKSLSNNGQIVIEVPNSDDSLLTLFNSDAFQKFSYWSQHLYLFNMHSLKLLAEQSSLRVIAIKQTQRYPLSNHLYWLSHGMPGGHKYWNFLDSPDLSSAYSDSLASIGKCDTLVAYLEKVNQ